MNCKHCQAELEEGVTLCPECGTENAEPVVEEAAAAEPAQAESEMKPGLSSGKITLLVVLAVAAVAVVIALIVGGMGGGETAETTLPTESMGASEPADTVPATVPADGNPDDATCKGTYTVDDAQMIAAADTVVATMGDAKLTNADLQVYYWMQVYDFLGNYGSYASMLGLDYTQGLDTQLSMEGTMTWQQYFLSNAITSWKNFQAMRMAAEADEFQMDALYADNLANLPAELEKNAETAGFENAQAMIQSDMGVGTTVDHYISYLRDYYIANLYFADQVDKITVTDDEVAAYFDEHSAEYAENGLEKTEERYVNVRHILLMPTGGTTDATGVTTYSEEEWAACKKAADDVLNEWLSGEQTEERFAELANTYSEDGGSNTKGGLYTNVYVGQMVEPFEDWCFDETRKTGDYGIVQTNYGYHVMYFVDSDPIWFVNAMTDLLSEKSMELQNRVTEAVTMDVDYSAIVLGDVSLVEEN